LIPIIAHGTGTGLEGGTSGEIIEINENCKNNDLL